jgi:glycerol-3-phosphate acyltransferase PlsY
LIAAVGHTWPVFFGFRGGKGAGTLIGGLCITWPASVLPVFLVWITSLVLSGYVGLSTVLAAAVLVPLAFAWAHTQLPFAIAAALFIAFTHRSNLRRLYAGTEHRFERVRVFHRRQTPAA